MVTIFAPKDDQLTQAIVSTSTFSEKDLTSNDEVKEQVRIVLVDSGKITDSSGKEVGKVAWKSADQFEVTKTDPTSTGSVSFKYAVIHGVAPTPTSLEGLNTATVTLQFESKESLVATDPVKPSESEVNIGQNITNQGEADQLVNSVSQALSGNSSTSKAAFEKWKTASIAYDAMKTNLDKYSAEDIQKAKANVETLQKEYQKIKEEVSSGKEWQIFTQTLNTLSSQGKAGLNGYERIFKSIEKKSDNYRLQALLLASVVKSVEGLSDSPTDENSSTKFAVIVQASTLLLAKDFMPVGLDTALYAESLPINYGFNNGYSYTSAALDGLGWLMPWTKINKISDGSKALHLAWSVNRQKVAGTIFGNASKVTNALDGGPVDNGVGTIIGQDSLKDLANKVDKPNDPWAIAGDGLGAIGTGMAAGAVAGSIIPGLGTLFGAGVGFVGGLIAGGTKVFLDSSQRGRFGIGGSPISNVNPYAMKVREKLEGLAKPDFNGLPDFIASSPSNSSSPTPSSSGSPSNTNTGAPAIRVA